MNLSDDLAALAQRYQTAAPLLADAGRHHVDAARSGWSVAGHLWHTEAAATGVLLSIARIVGGKGDEQGTSPAVVAFLEEGAFPPGRQAPASVQPPEEGVDDAALASRFTRNAAAFARLDPDALEAATGTLPHPVLGPLTAPLWVRFARIHAAHHDAITAVILGEAPAQP